MADATRNLDIIISAKDEATKTLTSFRSRLTDLNKDVKAAAIGMAGVGAATALMGKSFVQAAGEMQMQTTAFQTLIGDTTLANKTLKNLIDFAASTPFEIPQILEQSKRLLAMGTSAQNLIPTFEMLGNVAAGVGMEKLPQLVLAFGQIQSKGRLMGTELRQLTEAGFNLADAMGISNAKLDELVENKAVKFEDVRKAFEKVSGEGGRFHGLMDAIAKTVPGQMSNLSDSVFKLKVAFGEALLPAVADLLTQITPLILQFAEFAKANPEVVKGILAVGSAIGALGSAILVVGPIIKTLSGILSLFNGTFGLIIKALTGLVSVLGGPITIAIVLLTALIGGLALAWKNNWGDIQGKTKVAIDAISSGFNNLVSKGKEIIHTVTSIGKYFKDVFSTGDWANDWGHIEHMPQMIVGVVQSIGKLIVSIQDFGKAAGENFSKIGPAIAAFGDSIKEGAVNGFNNFIQVISHAYESVVSFIQAVPGMITKFFIEDLPYAIGFAAGRMERWVTQDIPFFIGMMVAAFTNFFTATVPALWAQFVTIFTTFIAFLSLQLVNFFTVTLPAAWTAFVTFFTSTIPAFLVQIGAMWNAMIENLSQSFNNFVTVTIPALVASFIAWINQMVAKVIALVIQLYTQFTAWIQKLIADVIAGIQTMPARVTSAMEAVKQAAVGKAKEIYDGVKEWFDKIIGFFNTIISKAGEAIGRAREAFSSGKQAGMSYQHGGFVDAPGSQAVPAVLHGGERIVPRNGTDVNPGSGGGGVTINITGSFNLDSESRVEELAQKISRMLGRENELASYGVGY